MDWNKGSKDLKNITLTKPCNSDVYIYTLILTSTQSSVCQGHQSFKVSLYSMPPVKNKMDSSTAHDVCFEAYYPKRLLSSLGLRQQVDDATQIIYCVIVSNWYCM